MLRMILPAPRPCNSGHPQQALQARPAQQSQRQQPPQPPHQTVVDEPASDDDVDSRVSDANRSKQNDDDTNDLEPWVAWIKRCTDDVEVHMKRLRMDDYSKTQRRRARKLARTSRGDETAMAVRWDPTVDPQLNAGRRPERTRTRDEWMISATTYSEQPQPTPNQQQNVIAIMTRMPMMIIIATTTLKFRQAAHSQPTTNSASHSQQDSNNQQGTVNFCSIRLHSGVLSGTQAPPTLLSGCRRDAVSFSKSEKQNKRCRSATLETYGVTVGTSTRFAKIEADISGCTRLRPMPRLRKSQRAYPPQSSRKAMTHIADHWAGVGAAAHLTSEQDQEMLSWVDASAWTIQNRLPTICGEYLTGE